MKRSEKSIPLFTLVIPLAVSLLVICVTAGYYIYRFARERAYREKWKDYYDCGLA
ncbi:hypothetical protein V6615_05730 [Oscillospiraceae bacterium PP1C4]